MGFVNMDTLLVRVEVHLQNVPLKKTLMFASSSKYASLSQINNAIWIR
ncbi:hypothetical protein [Paenibacillus sp. L3-i20]|nr:hypothetical protein [Paenibacillus sp. L3-i20]